MGGLAHDLETAGIATTQISLIREHSERMRPPRAMWVPFALGRPLGAAGDPVFQRLVLHAALDLLTAPAGPILFDYPEEAPDEAGEPGWRPDLPVGKAAGLHDGPRIRAEEDPLHRNLHLLPRQRPRDDADRDQLVGDVPRRDATATSAGHGPSELVIDVA